MKPVLYQFWRSSSSWRVRWALLHKRIEFDLVTVDLGTKEQLSPLHLARNPLGRVPALAIDRGVLAESVAILEYLEVKVPTPALYPRNPWLCARARQLVELVNSGIQPMQCPAALERVSDDLEKRNAFARHFNERGLVAYEQLLKLLEGELGVSGPFSLGEQFTAADLCLVSQLAGARRFGVDVTAFPRILAVEKAALATEFATAALPENQPGAPAHAAPTAPRTETPLPRTPTAPRAP